MRGLLFAHCGWLFTRQLSNRARFAPDLLADRDIVRVDRLFLPLVVVSLLAPPAVGGLLICHVDGERPFKTHAADRAANFWPLAVLSFGESWHNSHHADPTSARHGVLPGQVDASARLIWLLEKLGWVFDVRWPKPSRFAALRTP